MLPFRMNTFRFIAIIINFFIDNFTTYAILVLVG